MNKALEGYINKTSNCPLWRMNKLKVMGTLQEILEAAIKEEDDLLRDELRVPYWKLVYSLADKLRFNAFSTNEKYRPITINEEKRQEMIQQLEENRKKKEKRIQQLREERMEKERLEKEGVKAMQEIVDKVMEEVSEEEQSSEDSVQFIEESSAEETNKKGFPTRGKKFLSSEEKKAKATKPKKN